MPSPLHRAFVAILHDTPELAVRLALPELGRPGPARVVSEELSPPALTADLALLIGGARPRHALVVEVQLRRDGQKRWVWPAYTALLRLRHKVPVTLLVVTDDPGVARWAAAPIAVDTRGQTLRPVVIGPDELSAPEVAAQAAADVDLATLAALAHHKLPTGPPLAQAVLAALPGLHPDAAPGYIDIIKAAYAAKKEAPDMLRPNQYFAPDTIRAVERARRQGREEGREEGEVSGLIQGLRFGWVARFGDAPLPAAVEAAWAQAGAALLVEVGPAMLSAATPEAAAAAMLARLGRASGG
jgi:hypothetical protein